MLTINVPCLCKNIGIWRPKVRFYFENDLVKQEVGNWATWKSNILTLSAHTLQLQILF